MVRNGVHMEISECVPASGRKLSYNHCRASIESMAHK